MTPEFKSYQGQIVKNAAALAKCLIDNDMTLVSGGTDNHLMLLNVMAKGKTGKEVEALLDQARITVNKNTIPKETQSPFVTSGIRIGTPAVTSRGMKEDDMKVIGNCISNIVINGESAVADTLEKVKALCEKYPIYV